jgi:queuine tRNA-ribosyltransferase
MIATLAPRLPQDRPRYLMGMGKPADIIRAVQAGVDLFDCVIPTRNARNGQLFTWHGPLQIRNQKHAREREPIDPDCDCPACRRFSRSYLRHLFMANEMLGLRLNTLHNLFFYAELMRRIQNAIENGNYLAWAGGTIRQLEVPDKR